MRSGTMGTRGASREGLGVSEGQGVSGVKDARSTQMYSFLPASWTGDAHEETDFLPIGDREEKDMRLLNRRTDNLETRRILVAKYPRTKVRRDESRLLATNEV